METKEEYIIRLKEQFIENDRKLLSCNIKLILNRFASSVLLSDKEMSVLIDNANEDIIKEIDRFNEKGFRIMG